MALGERLRASLLTACAFWSAVAAAQAPKPKRPAAPAPAAEVSPAEAAAAEAYDEGAELYRQKRYGEAARSFARADELFAHPVALRQALDAALQADDPALAMALAERSEARSGGDAEAAALVTRARSRYADKTGKLVLRCPPPAVSCRALVDGDEKALGPPLGGWVLAGSHTLHVDTDGRLEPRTLTVAGGQTVDVGPVPAPVAPERPPPPVGDKGVRPEWFWGGVALTGVLGAATVWSGVDTASKHDRFVSDRDAGALGPDQADDGRAAQTRTNVLGGATIVVGLATAALGVFAVRWRPQASQAASRGAQGTRAGALPGLVLSF